MNSDRTLLLLPGLDGTGELFSDFILALPPNLEAKVVRYHTDRFLNYEDLLPLITDAIPAGRPFALLAESFSTPLAVKLAATNPPDLRALVVCAGFVRNPVPGWRPLMQALVRPSLFRVPPPSFVLEHLLIGTTPPHALRDTVRHVLRSITPDVIASRVRAAMGCDAREELARVGVPTLYLQAEHDRLVRKTCFEEIRQLKPDTVLASIPGPHLILQREPYKAADLIARFLENLPN